MDRNQILNTFNILAMSQGFYGRVLRDLDEMDEEEREATLDYLEEQNFTDALDLVMFMEG